MNRYKVTLTQVSIVDANDEIEARNKLFDTFDKNSLDVDVKLINNTDRVPMTLEEEYRNADVPMPKKNTFILMRNTHKILEVLKLKVINS